MMKFISDLRKTQHISAPLIMTFQAFGSAVVLYMSWPAYAVVTVGIVGGTAGLVLGWIYDAIAEAGAEKIMQSRKRDDSATHRW